MVRARRGRRGGSTGDSGLCPHHVARYLTHTRCLINTRRKKNEGRKRKEGREGGGEEREGKEVSSKSFRIWEEKRRELFTGLLKPTTTPQVSSGTSGPRRRGVILQGHKYFLNPCHLQAATSIPIPLREVGKLYYEGEGCPHLDQDPFPSWGVSSCLV